MSSSSQVRRNFPTTRKRLSFPPFLNSNRYEIWDVAIISRDTLSWIVSKVIGLVEICFHSFGSKSTYSLVYNNPISITVKSTKIKTTVEEDDEPHEMTTLCY